jgi:nucleoid-associated protein YejK
LANSKKKRPKPKTKSKATKSRSTAKVVAVVVHHLKKTLETEPEIDFGTGPLALDAAVDELAAKLLAFFHSDRSVLLGGFREANPQLHPVERAMKTYYEGKLSFNELTVRIAEQLENRLQGVRLATGGYLIFVDMKVGRKRELIFAMLNHVPGVRIDEDTLVLKLTKHLDYQRLRQAVRFELERYLERD